MELKDITHKLRKTVLEMCLRAGTGHVTSCFSCVELLTVLYYHTLQSEDKLIISKGQCSPLIYAILADKGVIDEKELWNFATNKGILGVHLDHHIPGVHITAGSLGHGLGIATGMGFTRSNINIFCLMGDGELHEGSVWEAMMLAGHHKLSNLVAIVDSNKLSATARNKDIMNVQPGIMAMGCGWKVVNIDGHDLKEITETFDWLMRIKRKHPYLIIAHTVKGKGLPFWENDILSHGTAPVDRAEEARRCLDG